MLIKEVLCNSSADGERALITIRTACDQFLRESAKLPLYKLLPRTYSDFQRVKVRQQKKSDNVTEVFNAAFNTQFFNLRQRAVFASPVISEATDEHEPFYVFPSNGYKFLYSKEVKNSNNDYKHVVDTLFEQFEDNNKAIEIVTDILKYTYVRENLVEGILSDSEIILYGIPQYYALRVSSVPPYGKLFTK